MDFNHGTQIIGHAWFSLLSWRFSPISLVMILLCAYFGRRVHEFGHLIAARHFGWRAEFIAFPAFRSKKFRAAHGWKAHLSLMMIDCDDEAMLRASRKELQLAGAAGPALEIALLLFAGVITFLWASALTQSEYMQSYRPIFMVLVTWISIELPITLIADVIPNKFVLNDGYVIFFPDQWLDTSRRNKYGEHNDLFYGSTQ